MILFSSVLYYQLFTAEKLVRLAYSFEFWVATALILFYSVNFTYLGMLHYMANSYRELSLKLLVLLQIMNIVFYLLLAYAFICKTLIRKEI